MEHQRAYFANMDLGRGKDDVYLDIADGLETTEIPRVLITAFRRCSQI